MGCSESREQSTPRRASTPSFHQHQRRGDRAPAPFNRAASMRKASLAPARNVSKGKLSSIDVGVFSPLAIGTEPVYHDHDDEGSSGMLEPRVSGDALCSPGLESAKSMPEGQSLLALDNVYLPESDSGSERCALDVYKVIDAGQYLAARRELADMAAAVEPDSCERVLIALGLSVLDSLNVDEWDAPPALPHARCVILEAVTVLEEVAPRSPTAYLALAVYFAAFDSIDCSNAIRCRSLAAGTPTYPLGALCHSAATLRSVRTRYEAGAIDVRTYAKEATKEADALTELALAASPLVAVQAAKCVWGLYYQGKPPFARDLAKAKSLLEVIVDRLAASPLQEQYSKKLARVEQKMAEHVHQGAKGRPLLRSMRSLSPRGSEPATPRLSRRASCRTPRGDPAPPLASASFTSQGLLSPRTRLERSESLASLRSKMSTSNLTALDDEPECVSRGSSRGDSAEARRAHRRKLRARGATIAESLQSVPQ